MIISPANTGRPPKPSDYLLFWPLLPHCSGSPLFLFLPLFHNKDIKFFVQENTFGADDTSELYGI